MNDGVSIDRARAGDVAAIVAMLADDALGARRESPGDPKPYMAAFEDIDADPRQYLAVARRDGRVVGTLQLTFVPGLSHRGSTRAQVEAVRVDSDERGGGLGIDLLLWAEEEARRRGAAILQLTSDASREDAHRFYERLGYTASHVGFKKRIG
ncbi:GNAT superfamily N-acetyltransferase [Nocardiopsis arvandica]|uniref:GNAT superfamily N-acetyltransferase n=1 Tax=Nocardiopsis sinuspersici TaxID=501010 RepID=A0A7Z0BHX5_9ACTN|nr:GNAT family N-acetyltransferase [Nocardiopsis sinuspersici]NYH51496.1 GNAT superfamily N-acetyltransferase [Nocardiopsis sinuspersici]